MKRPIAAKILVVDDDPAIRLVVSKALQKQGYEVILASDGQEGVDLALQHCPDLIICDWIMPGLDGLEVCRRVKAAKQLTTTFFVLLTSRGEPEDRVIGLDTGADDFLAKPINISELQARVRAALRIHQLSQDLQTQKQLLEAELMEAAIYVRSLLPSPMTGAIEIDARFLPCRQLGGDCFDYFWLDPDYLAIYLLDVSGHGLGAALPSSLVLNLLRSRSLPSANFYQPHDVLSSLNEAFQMGNQNQKYLTIWYGVYNCSKRQLSYASAGHPPAILLTSASNGSTEVHQLRTPSVPIGILPETTYTSDRQTIPENSILYVFSDGIYEIGQATGSSSWGLEGFIDLLVDLKTEPNLNVMLDRVQRSSGTTTFDDDLSILRIEFR
ncbi:PP2C family protein-serine/threonine phosphatase [Egbenema bharatensis]|uniref:PP2C family protein-serine/threonine phosphatase n=1 Tax=Egbenema bharatensis TaxID=3463334 RepID=UPI003A89081E